MSTDRACLIAMVIAMLIAVAGCTETPALPPDSPQNPASSAAAEGPMTTPTVLAKALGAPAAIAGVAPVMDHTHHHHGAEMPDGGTEVGADAGPGSP